MDDALRKAAQPEQQAKPVADELGWLIEMRPSENLLWWDGGFDVSDDYPSKRLFARMVNDANKAVRFSRREDAQCVLDAMLAVRPSPLFASARTLYSVQEHIWHSAAQAEPVNQRKPCEHPRNNIIRADCIAWCGDCGVITWASDASERVPGADARARKKWCAENVVAWGCEREAAGGECCEHWCQNGGCTVTLRIAHGAAQATAPVWLLPGEVAQRIGNEHRVSAAVIQDISHALHKMATQPQQAAAPKGE